jgi:Tol biopolymer transport system component
MRHVLVVALALAVCVVLSPDSVNAQSSRIVFRSDHQTAPEPRAWKMIDDGTQKARITTSGSAYNPNLCSDGQNVVFDNDDGIFIVGANGGTPAYVTGGPYDGDADCGRKVGSVYKIVFECSSDICTVDSDGSALQTRFASGLVDYHPAWCGNSKIVFSKQRTSALYEFQICTMPAASGDPTCFSVPDGYSDRFPSCNENLEKIAFVRSQAFNDAKGDICTINYDGTGLDCFVREDDPGNEDFDDTRPSFSPSGSQLTYASDYDGEWDIWIRNTNGSGDPQNLTEDQEGATCDEPDWGGASL